MDTKNRNGVLLTTLVGVVVAGVLVFGAVRFKGDVKALVLAAGLIAAVFAVLFGIILMQRRRSVQAALEREAAEAQDKARNEELERRIAQQEREFEHEHKKAAQSELIAALAADYWSLYYIDLDENEGICLQEHGDVEGGYEVGDHFAYREAVTSYARANVTPQHREEFLQFVRADAIREGLKKRRIISYRYQVHRHGRDSWEMARFAEARRQDDDGDDRGEHAVRAVGACFIDVDDETLHALAQNEALSVALATAEDANRAKTAFLAGVSNEIGAPVGDIVSLGRAALADPEIPAKTRDYLQGIGATAERLLSLTSDLLDACLIESGRMTLKSEEFSLLQLLEDINALFSAQCQEKGIDYQYDVEGEVGDSYVGDGVRLRQVLSNILGNAVKFTPEGGSVELDVKRTERLDGKATLRFVITDNGIGMSEEFLPRIFDAFSREDSSPVNARGSAGLGMAIAKSIVEMMGGSIKVGSRQGLGTMFTVTVMLQDGESATGGAAGEESAV